MTDSETYGAIFASTSQLYAETGEHYARKLRARVAACESAAQRIRRTVAEQEIQAATLEDHARRLGELLRMVEATQQVEGASAGILASDDAPRAANDHAHAAAPTAAPKRRRNVPRGEAPAELAPALAPFPDDPTALLDEDDHEGGSCAPRPRGASTRVRATILSVLGKVRGEFLPRKEVEARVSDEAGEKMNVSSVRVTLYQLARDGQIERRDRNWGIPA